MQRGTGAVVKAVGKPLAGKTGTTNDAKDVWFVGFSPDLAVGVFLGYDKPQLPRQRRPPAGQYAAPVFRDFMQMALKDKPRDAVPRAARHQADPRHAATGMRAGGEGGGTILEAFKPGTAPPDTYSRHRRRGATAGRRPESQPARRRAGRLYGAGPADSIDRRVRDAAHR